MKILLVAMNAKYIHSNLAVYSLKAYAKKYAEKFFENSGNCIEIAEYTINQHMDFILRDIYIKRPDVIAFSCYIWNVSMMEEIIENVHKILPETSVWLGGPEVSYVAESYLEKHRNVKGIMRGEGEKIFKSLADAYGRALFEEDRLNRILGDIRGITFRAENNIEETPDEFPVDMSDIPFVYQDLQEFENRIIYYESSRGCPFSCSYCLSSIDKHLRFRDIELVKKELKFFMDHKTAQVKFVDRTFNCKKSHAMEIWKFIKENDNGITNFHFEIAADIITEDEIEIIKTMRPGLIQLEIGVQTTNPDTIHLIDRKMDFDKVADVVMRLKTAENVHIHLDLIAGLPQEDIQSFMKSFNDVYALKPEQLQLGFLKVLHGSKMEQQVKEHEMKYRSRPPYEVFSTKWLDYGDILRLKNVEEVLEIYYNSGQFAYCMEELERYFETPFMMYDSLGKFYHSQGVHGEKHSRIRRYDILLEFYRENVYKNTENQRAFSIFVQLLTYDLYLRDNVKSRPAFAANTDGYKKEINNIYIKEEKERKLLPDYEGYNSKQLAKMTHIERFDFDIESYRRNKIDNGRENYIIFDYKNRNALNYAARVIPVEKTCGGNGDKCIFENRKKSYCDE